MAKLSAEQRDRMPAKEFALSGGRYPINDESHARMALAMVAKHGTPEEQRKVKAKVKKKFPNIEVS